MATTIIKSANSDNQALVDSTGHLLVTVSGGGGGTDTNLVSVSGSPITLGQAAMAASLPVVIASNQTPLAVSQSGVWTVGRTWALTSGADSISAVQSGTWNIGNITGTITLPTGAATSALQTSGNASLASIDSKLTSPLTVTGAVSVTGTVTANAGTGTFLVDGSAHTQPISGAVSVSNFPATQPISGTVSVSNFPATQAISAVSLPLPAGASTATNQATANTSLASIDSKLTSPLAVTGTFFQATQPVSGNLGRTWSLLNTTDSVNAVQSGAYNITNISGTVSLPTGAATSANQTTANASLSSIDSKTPPLGQALSAASVPVVLPATQITALTPLTTVTVTQATGSNLHTQVDSSALPTGAATSANQATEITSLASIDSKLTSPLVTTPADSLPATQAITVQDTGSTSTSGANAQVAVTGTATAGSTASFTISSKDTVKIQVTGTWTGTLVNEISLDSGVTWYSNGVHQTGSAYTAGSFTANYAGGLNVSGSTNFRVRATAAVTGTATVRIISTVNNNSIYIANGLSVQDATVETQKLSILASGAARVDSKTPLSPSSPTSTSVAVTSGAAIAANANRKGLIFTNTSSGNISFGLGAAAVLNSGITLTPNGVWVMDEYTFTTGAINAIAAVAASNLAIQELT